MTVALVGAGPGDPELITLKGLVRVRDCEVLVYDRLVAGELVQEAPPHAIRIERDGLEQESVNALLVAHGRRGRRVVRLKGGDPYLFGRGGEEAVALARAGVPFEVIPGVSSLTAVSASAGIPITHRGFASAVTAFAAHDVERLDARALANAPGTLVAFMGLAGLGRLAERLVEHGRAPSTAAAVISAGTTPDEEVVVAPLGSIARAARGLRTPALVVVGEVVAVRDALQRAGQRGAPRSREIPRAASSTAAATSGSRLRRSSRSRGPATPTAPIASVRRSKIGAATPPSPSSASSRSTA
jgi:uroporphyrin-III C-methyltransferase